MRNDQPTTPFDVDADDLTQQFWGTAKGWVSSEQPAVRPRPTRPTHTDDTTGSLRAIREGFAAFRPQTSPNATGEIRRQRQHGASRPTSRPEPSAAPSRREATLGELAVGRSDVGGWIDPFDDAPIPAAPRGRPPGDADRIDADRFDADHEADYDVPLTPVPPLAERFGLGAVDPLLVRAGVIVLALILLVPVLLSLRPDRDDSLPGDLVEAPQPVAAGAAPAPSTTARPAGTAAPASAPATTAFEAPAGESATVGAVDVAPDAAPAPTTAAETSTTHAEPVEAAAVDVAAERVVPACPQTYTAAAGDSWYRIADAAGVEPTALLAENNATTGTVILPGDDICLPAGASMPTPPPTTTPATTAPAPAEAAPTTTAAPSTTAAPTTAAPTTTAAPVVSMSRAEVQALIRETWPEEEVETALDVARRESNFIATADNGWCCVGVFQIYWSVHDEWLDDFGIHSRSDLFDARKNIAAAHHMWEQSGWGPWGG